jgi:hypothetical protein
MIKVQHKSWKQRSCGGSRGVEKQEAHEGYGSEKVVRLLLPKEGFGPRLGLIALKGRWPPSEGPAWLRRDARMVCKRGGMCIGVRGVWDHECR